MIFVVGNDKLRKFMGTDDLYQFQEEVLINNIKVLHPNAIDITIHANREDNNKLVALVIE